jgi:hypothetical protein
VRQLAAEGRDHFNGLVAEVEYERSLLASAEAEPHTNALNGTASGPSANRPKNLLRQLVNRMKGNGSAIN